MPSRHRPLKDLCGQILGCLLITHPIVEIAVYGLDVPPIERTYGCALQSACSLYKDGFIYPWHGSCPGKWQVDSLQPLYHREQGKRLAREQGM